MLGSHLSIAGGMINALREARRLKLDCVQIFTANQRQWNPRPPSADEQTEWLADLRTMNWDTTDGASDSRLCRPVRVVSHNSYLINMASPDPAAWKKSVAAMRAEIERCEGLHVPLVVAHPGAHLGTPRKARTPNDLSGAVTADERGGIERIVKALNQLHRDLPGYRTIVCLETTVGSGTTLGYCFEHLARMREGAREPDRIGFCFDTCHVTAAGYSMCRDADAMAVMQRWNAACGVTNLRVFHLNDSIGAIGSRLDRHAHIGEGCCGKACFRFILNQPALADVPKILETPKERDHRGRSWDSVNIQRLRRMPRQTLQSAQPVAR